MRMFDGPCNGCSTRGRGPERASAINLKLVSGLHVPSPVHDFFFEKTILLLTPDSTAASFSSIKIGVIYHGLSRVGSASFLPTVVESTYYELA